MKNLKLIIGIIAFIVLLLIWAPWVTDDFAKSKAVENYPDTWTGAEKVEWAPFGKIVGPNRSGRSYYVFFWGKSVDTEVFDHI